MILAANINKTKTEKPYKKGKKLLNICKMRNQKLNGLIKLSFEVAVIHLSTTE
tara:strand:- start:448 stop:606 length:159 start_codon:yes stop_codon:yes gene_type:complete